MTAAIKLRMPDHDAPNALTPAEMWRIASSVDLDDDERRRLDGAIRWALGAPGRRPSDAALVRLLGANALADGAFHAHEFRLLLRTLLHAGCTSAADLKWVVHELAVVRAEVALHGAADVVAEVGEELAREGLSRAALRIGALCVAADHGLDGSELEAYLGLADALDVPATRARDTLVTATALFARSS